MAEKKVPAEELYNVNWHLWIREDAAGRTVSPDRIQIVLLQEIRGELQELNRLLHCQNFQGLPGTLRRLDRRLQKALPLIPKEKG